MASDSQKNQSEQEKAEQEQEKVEQKRIDKEQKALDKREKETQKAADENDTKKQSGLGVAGDNPAEASKADESDLLDPTEDGYDPYQDPSVPSSPIADNIRVELADGKGKSPTLDACREAYKAEVG